MLGTKRFCRFLTEKVHQFIRQFTFFHPFTGFFLFFLCHKIIILLEYKVNKINGFNINNPSKKAYRNAIMQNKRHNTLIYVLYLQNE